MLFHSLIFVFAFLPVYIIAMYLCRSPWSKNAASALAALIFLTWGRRWYYALIVVPVFLIYISGIVKNRAVRRVLSAAGLASAVAYTLLGTVFLNGDELLSALLSVGMMLFLIRCAIYCAEISGGAEPERDLFALAAYLMPLEGMLISPVYSYESVRERLYERRQTLSKMSSGLCGFIKGFALAAIAGNAFERVRLAAVEYEAFPWLNALALAAVTVCECYVMILAYLEMSGSIGLMCGLSPKLQTGAFYPRSRVSEHVAGIWESLPKSVGKALCGGSLKTTALMLAVLSLLSGAFIGFGAGAASCFGIVLIAIVIEGRSESHRASDAIFSVLMTTAAFSALVLCSSGGAASFFAAFDINRYDYDVTYALNSEFLRSWPWMAVGLVFISPLPAAISSWVRSLMTENKNAYVVGRIAETVICVLLMFLATVAAAA